MTRVPFFPDVQMFSCIKETLRIKKGKRVLLGYLGLVGFGI